MLLRTFRAQWMKKISHGSIDTKAESSSPESHHKTKRYPTPIRSTHGISSPSPSPRVSGIILLGITILPGILSLKVSITPGQVGYYETAGLVTLLLSTVLAMPLFFYLWHETC